MKGIFVVAQDEQGGPVAIGPLTEGINDALYAEIEDWGWTVISGYVRTLTLTQARREARTGEIA